jgi:hypothetical protein
MEWQSNLASLFLGFCVAIIFWYFYNPDCIVVKNTKKIRRE